MTSVRLPRPSKLSQKAFDPLLLKKCCRPEAAAFLRLRGPQIGHRDREHPSHGKILRRSGPGLPDGAFPAAGKPAGKAAPGPAKGLVRAGRQKRVSAAAAIEFLFFFGRSRREKKGMSAGSLWMCVKRCKQGKYRSRTLDGGPCFLFCHSGRAASEKRNFKKGEKRNGCTFLMCKLPIVYF